MSNNRIKMCEMCGQLFLNFIEPYPPVCILCESQEEDTIGDEETDDTTIDLVIEEEWFQDGE